ncbi:MAG: hypothetical protein IID14_00125 [Candidatus Marinimicrobia bacterium]|nr:hypothetical protein [Candidatus Neomarinimicrobiota bacterium]
MVFKILVHRSTLRGDLLITMVNGISVLLGIFLLYGLIARVMGVEALGELLLVRRTALTLMGLLLIGMNIGLPYYIGKEGDQAYAANALVLYLFVTIPLVGVLSGFLYLGGLPGFPKALVPAFFIMAAGYAMQYLAYGQLRGHLNMLAANLVQLVGIGLIPLGAFIIFKSAGVGPILIATGLGTFFFAGVVYLTKMGRGYASLDLKKAGRLLAYGFRRVPSSLAQFVLLGGVPLLILSDTGHADIAYVNAGISLIRLFMVVVGPLGIVLLPRISRALAEGRQAQVGHGLELLSRGVLFVGVPLALYLSMNHLTITTIWLGAEGAEGAWIVQIMTLALPFYLLMEVLRSPIDAASTRGYNSVIYSASALVLLICFYGLKTVGLASVTAGTISFVAGQITASMAGIYYANRIYHIRILSRPFGTTILGVAALAFLILHILSVSVSGPAALLIGGGILGGALSLYFFKSRADWVVGVRAVVLAR